MTWRFDWITGWDEVWSEPFLAQWHEWMETSPTAHVFFHPALVRAWVETYLPLRRMEPRFLIATRDDCTVFLPMVLWRRNWKNAFQRLLIPVGYSDYDYHDPIVSPRCVEMDWSTFWTGFASEVAGTCLDGDCDAIELPGVREAHISAQGCWQCEEECPFIDLSAFASLDDFLSTLAKKHCYNLRRRRRLLESAGTVTYEVFRSEQMEDAHRELGAMLVHHGQRWPSAYKAPRFHERLVRYGLRDGLLHFSRLCLDDQAISWRICFIFHDRFYSYMPAYNQEYERFSPGQMHLLLCIEEAVNAHMRTYDQLRGTESYKDHWAADAVGLYTLHIGMRGVLPRARNFSVARLKPALCQAARSWRGG